MNRLFITMFIYLLIICYYTDAQNYSSVENLTDLLEELGIEREEPDLYEDLSYLMNNPLDINKATFEELIFLPFLTDEQIESIIDFREKQGELVSLYELKNIEKIDFQTIRFLLPFVCINENSVENIEINVHKLLNYGRNELVTRYNDSFQQKRGYKHIPDSILQDNPNKKYLGKSYYHSLRYSYTYDTHIQAGIIMEKDPGEPFWNQQYKGYDYYSAHIALKDINRFKTIILGDFKASFGQGLIISQDYNPGQSSMVTQGEKKSNGFRRHFSTNEYDYLRGIALSYTFSNFDISLFYSYRKLGGIMDSCYIRSIKKDGIHRLQREQERKRLFPLMSWGGNIRYTKYRFKIGITGVMTSFKRNILHPEEKPYNLYYLRGSNNMNVGVDYVWKKGNIKFFGEAGMAKNKSFANLHGFQITPVSYITLLGMYRYYDKQYQNFYAKSFSQQSQVQNEQGYYVGISLTPFPYWKLSGYVDIFKFPWLKYGINAPSRGKEYMIQLDRSLSRSASFYIRYRYNEKEKNDSSVDINKVIRSYSQQKIQYQLRVEPAQFQLRTSIEYGTYYFGNIHYKGYMFSQALGWKPENLPLRVDLFGGWFNTDHYNVRFRSVEKTLLYDFYTPVLYGKGIRLSGVLQWAPVERVFLTAKIAHSLFPEQETVGTALEEIEGNEKTDFYIQIRWKF